MSSGSQILAFLSKHWWLNCSTFALQSSKLWIKFTLFKAMPMSSDLSCSDPPPCYCSDPWALYKTTKTHIHQTRRSWFCPNHCYCSNLCA
jgi:hypothetical protein